VVTTGVVTEFVELSAGDEAVADFGALGEARVAFGA
jgi:2-keto-4-pentenoate hydratase